MAAYTTIDDPSVYFQSTLYAGDNDNSTVITNTGNSDLQADLIWIKSRTHGNSGTGSHMLFDSSRGIKSTTGSNSPYLSSDSTNEEATNNNGLQAIGSNTFTPGSMTRTNESGDNYVAWQWKVNGGTTTSLSSNIDSVCQVNQAAGISIVKYTCTGGGNGQAVQHGLGLVPEVIITKNRDDTNYSDWITYHHSIGDANFLKLNTAVASAGSSPYAGAAPTNSTYNVSNDLVEQKKFITYCFAPIQGYSKFGKYVGNGGADGPFVYTGFKPAWIMVKNSSLADYFWVMLDNKRNPTNLAANGLSANTSGAEANTPTDFGIDFLSNGFKIRAVNTGYAGGSTGNTLIYMAFAENPFVTSTGIPTTAL